MNERSIIEALKLASGHHQSGQLLEAERIYLELLEKDPENIDALHRLGCLWHQTGRNEIAVESISRAIAIAPDRAEFHDNLGVVLKALGRTDDAVASFHRAVSLKPNSVNAMVNLGTAYFDQQKIDQAIESYQRAIAIHPNHAVAYLNLGIALAAQKRYDEAVTCFQRALQIDPQFTEVYSNLGSVLHEQKRLDHALTWYEQAIQLQPNEAAYHTGIGTVLFDLERYNDAIASYSRAVSLAPDSADAHHKLGQAFAVQNRHEEAATHFQRAIEIQPDFHESFRDLAVVLYEQREFQQSLQHFERALELKPGDAETLFKRSAVSLSTGDFEEGWRDYEARWQYQIRGEWQVPPRDFPEPLWDGDDLSDKTILVYGEQGSGDEIMFASCLPDVIQRAGRCVVECDPRLVPLFGRSFPTAEVTARPIKHDPETNSVVPAVDVQIPMGSLPRFFRPDLESFPERSCYLSADCDQTTKWSSRLANLEGSLRVGISWRGGVEPQVRSRKSTCLEQWKPVLSLPGVSFINLQYGDCREELESIKNSLGVTIHDWDDADPLVDLDNFAAEVAALDLVISITNTTIHMAGALGAEAWTLLPFTMDWRWILGRENSPWYARVRVFRQPSPGRWEDVFNRAAELLRERIEKT